MSKAELRRRAAKRAIEARNKKFAAATPAQRRVMIAKDVLAQIKARRLRPRAGKWLDVGVAAEIRLAAQQLDASVAQLFLAKDMPACECCALGSLFMGCALTSDKTTFSDFVTASASLDEAIENPEQKSVLTRYFSPAQLRTIEMAFEDGLGAFEFESEEDSWNRTLSDNTEDPTLSPRDAKLHAWRKRYPKDRDCLIAIMQNIIDNGGTFKP